MPYPKPATLSDDWSIASAEGHRPKKRLGQHFLTDPEVLARIVDTADLSHQDTVVEVGPGRGVLTAELKSRAGCLVAVELDVELLPALHKRFDSKAGFHLIHADILTQPPRDLLAQAGLPPEAPYKVVANLPYYITAPVLRHFLADPHPPTSVVVLVQYEVARTLTATPGDLSLLGIAVQYYGRPTLIAKVAPSSFSPPPKVHSAILRIDVYPAPPVDVPSEAAFFSTVKAGFRAKRKQLRNSLARGWEIPAEEAAGIAEKAGIDPQRRPETLSLAEWAQLTWVWERRIAA
ncbi:MAG: ribosomal RNA small subunit methyltransferase A [Dehalococcoidia bacterium]|nr:ribosomal RNA small subunit methyltransferase A [Dehalococcoidia bacterium]